MDNIKKIVTGTLITGLAMVIFPFNSVAYASPILKIGSRGDEVKEVQQLLSNYGLIQNSHITGYYGSITYNAVKTFQSQNGLQADGIAGPATIQKLNHSNLSGKLFKLGDEYPEVSTIQSRLKDLGFYRNSQITQYYGPITQEAVRDFQRANGLQADGIAGDATIDKLFAADANKNANTNQSLKKETSEPSRGSSNAPSANASVLIDFAKKYQGKPYVYGGSKPSGFDCSGFTSYVFRNFGIGLPRTAKDQANASFGVKISNRGDLKPGDLVFFTNSRGGNSRPIGHAGIYIGGGDFIHASSGKKSVIISTLNSGYYKDGFCWGRRILK